MVEMAESDTSTFWCREAPIHALIVGAAFHKLTTQENSTHTYRGVLSRTPVNHFPLLADEHDARAAWHGTRIILRQTSPESIEIYDMIILLYDLCGGDWDKLAARCSVIEADMQAFLQYAACFLSNIGNYYASHSVRNR
jgi:hypothetical protein